MWPLPVIFEMLQRIRRYRAKYFATLDMTSGFHQVIMDDASQAYTAFITFSDVFIWLVVPFGLKGAPAYFQKLLATIVLSGLIYIICELYIDDILVYACTSVDFS